MKRNSYSCVQALVSENAASKYDDFAKNLRDHRDFEDAWEDFNRQIVRARTK